MSTHPLAQIYALEKAKRATTDKEIVTLIDEYGLVREHIPTQYLKSRDVWRALLKKMPMTALIRNLATLSRVGLLTPMSEAGRYICEQLTNEERLKAARVHPIQLLSALRVYSLGGKPHPKASYYSYFSRPASRSQGGEFEPLSQVKDALEEAFYLSFGNVEPSGKRTLLGFDVSGSMMSGEIAGVPGLVPAEAAALMGMVTARAEWSKGDVSYPLYHCIAFDTGAKPFALSPTEKLEQVTKRMGYNGGGTDCSLPMTYALEKQIAVDTFVVYTDNETYSGRIHPSQALNQYRNQTGIPAKLIVVGLTSTGFSIADSSDAGMLDCVGFDLSTPQLITRFSKGEL